MRRRMLLLFGLLLLGFSPVATFWLRPDPPVPPPREWTEADEEAFQANFHRKRPVPTEWDWFEERWFRRIAGLPPRNGIVRVYGEIGY